MSMAEMTQEELVQEVLDRVLQSSTGVEDLETVTSLSGVKSLPGEKDGKMVNVPLELIGKPASDAAARAEAAAKKAEGAVAGLEERPRPPRKRPPRPTKRQPRQKTPLPRWNRLRQQPSAGLPHAFPHGWKQATFYLTRVPNRAAA